ncbi:TylF/MycF/NovP-related O-methyltransferase [Magnetospirillum molischianum]|uniref:Macrocin-O-methyltransferase n=1 Tax=Magnetospirillum molischianum DSM 120 TaxID=1150626 RepID=H8FS18_MAGML|nr:TylF/MycF/NovP-related O-methyltransferase [Magnetospirillum molischianum]CCG41156.1 Macrocin-O-methyltransferase [Magnetospirillum molischianum DSM 120]
MSLYPSLGTDASLADRYLRLIKRSLLNELYLELEAVLHYLLLCRRQGAEPDAEVIRDIAARRPDIMARLVAVRNDGNMVLWPEDGGRPYDPRDISEHVHTMIGCQRLDHLHFCLDAILAEDIPGDMIETGVWRGGATIFMRAHLAAHGVTDRIVWVADSFRGVPAPSVQEDKDYDLSKRRAPILAVSEERVKALFARYDLLDDQVRFLPGWFRDTLPQAPTGPIALLRLDGDLYESTMDALLTLYDRVVPGGFIIIDDYGALPPCRQAVEDFRTERGITTPLEPIDWTGMAWRKEGKRPPRSESSPDAPFTVIERPQPPLSACDFYHTMETPEGVIAGQWDLRTNTAAYLGAVDFAGKSVLEIGPASGYLTFHMEQAGASVTAVEPPLKRLWDVFPHQGIDRDAWRASFLQGIIRVRNSFWYMHHHLKSQTRLIETVPEAVPAAIGRFDIGVLAAILLHTRSPFSILESVAARVNETIIVTDLYDSTLGELPVMRLIPDAEGAAVLDTWWSFSPRFFVQALGCLGFPNAEVHIHHQHGPNGMLAPMFTVVACRPSVSRSKEPGREIRTDR